MPETKLKDAPARIEEALADAITMLRAIANGGSYDAFVYWQKIHAMEAALPKTAEWYVVRDRLDFKRLPVLAGPFQTQEQAEHEAETWDDGAAVCGKPQDGKLARPC